MTMRMTIMTEIHVKENTATLAKEDITITTNITVKITRKTLKEECPINNPIIATTTIVITTMIVGPTIFHLSNGLMLPLTNRQIKLLEKRTNMSGKELNYLLIKPLPLSK